MAVVTDWRKPGRCKPLRACSSSQAANMSRPVRHEFPTLLPHSRVQGIPHDCVVVLRLFCVLFHAAEVVLEVVDAPARKVRRVDLLESERAWVAFARRVAGIRVDAKLEPK
eukprot:5393176-Prymnesium_polylepis.1